MDKIKARKLIGRDYLLAKEIYPRIRQNKGFILVGQKGIGKSELLKWAYEHYDKENKIYLSCNETRGEMIKGIAKKLGIIVGKKKIAELEREVLSSTEEITLFIDDLERISPKKALFITALGNWNVVYLAGVGPFKERVKKLLWGKQKIRVKSIKYKYRIELGYFVAKSLGCMISPETIARESKGIPGRAWAVGKGEVIRDDDERVEGEEINIAPVMLVGVIAIMITRYVALGIGERDLYVLAGIGMACSYLLRYVIRIVSR